jgi:hypothetical protein
MGGPYITEVSATVQEQHDVTVDSLDSARIIMYAKSLPNVDVVLAEELFRPKIDEKVSDVVMDRVINIYASRAGVDIAEYVQMPLFQAV